MKPIKMLGLLAALMAMALVGASSAMAGSTSLCKADEGTCSAGNQISHVHETSVTKATLLGAVEVKCDVLFLGDTVGGTLNSLLAISGKFTYTNCVRENGKACEVNETSASSSISALRTGSELSTVTGNGEVNVHCGIFINCTYDGENLSGHGLGALTSTATNGEVRLEKQETHRVSGFCPETAELDILTTPLEKTYISA